MATGFCRSCRAPVQWAVTPSGSWIALEPGAHERGNLIETQTSAGRTVVRMADLTDPPGPRRLAHFATCPDASSWRRR